MPLVNLRVIDDRHHRVETPLSDVEDLDACRS